MPNVNKKALTLVELLAATVILGVVIIPIASLFLMNLVLIDRSRELTQVMAVAENQIEQIRNLPYEQILAQVNQIQAFNFAQPAGTGQIVVRNWPLPNSDNLLRISVSMQWTGSRTGQTIGPVVMETFLARR